jgi:glycosyltransferase involved in cell wall biosynthesis
MPRLLYVTTAPITLRSFLLPYARHFRAQGWRVDAATGGEGIGNEERDAFDAVHPLPISRRLLETRFVATVRELQRVVRAGRYDLVHVHTPIAAWVTRFALRQEGVPVVYTAHGFHFFPGGKALGNWAYRTLERIGRRWTHSLVVINDHDRRVAITDLRYEPSRVRHWPGIGVPVASLAVAAEHRPAARRALRTALGLATDTFLFVYPAEFNPGKRHADLIEAFAALGNAASVLLLAGDGARRSELEALARRLGVQSRVIFLGHRPDLPMILSAADCVVFPSEREGLSRSVMEAMAIGCPVIGSTARGVHDLLQDDCGWTFPVGNVPALSRVMGVAVVDAAARRRRAENAARAITAYDIPVLLDLHETHYREILEEHAHVG